MANELIMFSALGITMFALDITPQVLPNNLYNTVAISSFSLSVVTTVLSTVIIVIRILMVSRMPGASHQPRIALEIVVESAALYFISALVFTPMVSSFDAPSGTYHIYPELFFAYMAVEYHPSYFPFSSINCPSQNFSPALIMLRVVLGRARPDTEWSGKISGLHFNSAPGAPESVRSRGVTSTILTVPRSHHREEVDLEADGEPRTEPSDREEEMVGRHEGKARV
jgi:hypothetical protein